MRKFKKVYLEITNVCNLACSFCPGTSRSPLFMREEQFETLLRKLAGYTEYLYFHVMGEPLLHPGVVRFIELSGRYGYKVNITTNGTLIGKHADELIGCNALRQVNFSLHSQEGTGDGAQLENYLEEILSFADRVLAGGRINISFRLWNLHPDKTESFNTFVARKLELHYKPELSLMEAIRQPGRNKLGNRAFLDIAGVFQWPAVTADETGQEGFCLGLRDQIAVLVDGTVVPCCLDSGGIIRLGNIFEEELQEILEGERALMLYEGFSQRRTVEELCRKCGYRSRFSKEGR